MGASITPRYFLPWWSSDYVWEEWTVADDMAKNPAWNKVYLWEFMPDLLDGILVSRMAVSPKRISIFWFRQAWMSGQHNYFMVDGTRHTSYRATRIGLGDFEASQLEWSMEVTCPCPICKAVGQQILLLRGHERNTRRGFHNVYQYIQLLKNHRIKQEISSCT